jgi:hypothetical protein
MTHVLMRESVVRQAFAWRRKLLFGLVIFGIVYAAVLKASGFSVIAVSTERDTMIYRPSWWWLPVLAVPEAMFLIVGWSMVTFPKVINRIVGTIALVGAVFMAFVIPTALCGHLDLTRDGFSHTAGFWWNPVTKHIQFDMLESISLAPTKTPHGASFVMRFKYRDGRIEEIRNSTLLEAALRRIVVYATARGVAFHSQLATDNL